MAQQQCVDVVRRLVGGVMADAWQDFELIGYGDEVTGPLGGRPSDHNPTKAHPRCNIC